MTTSTAWWKRFCGSSARLANAKLSNVPLDSTPIPDELRGLRLALLVSGGIAAYKVVDLASALTQAGCEVRVAMTPSA
ncbi:MAG TPA: flavoprotein, partial [Candidatus Dormibacteraeota bacterium]|nr:flavoprotein [Candidatus Dormibacteraeota bacterium]